MSVAVVTYANLGRKTNIPTADIEPVLELLKSRGDLVQVICQINTGFPFHNTRSSFPFLIRVAIRCLALLGITVSRRSEEAINDFFAAQLLKRADLVLFHGGFSTPRTLKRAKAFGAITVDLARTAHFLTNRDLEQQELGILGAKNTQGTYSELSRLSPHLNDFDYVIAMSDFVYKSYVAQGYLPERILQAYPDIDRTRFAPAIKKNDSFRVLYMAYTTPLKGLHYLLEAWSVLGLRGAELVIAGGFDLPKEIKKQYERETKGSPTIKIVGDVTQPEHIYPTASVFVFPSLTEGFGRVTLEAMACGIPVITTEHARGIVEDGKTGFVVPIRDAKALAEKIKYLYDNREIAKEMGRQARLAVENKKPFGEAVYEIYQEILKREGKSL